MTELTACIRVPHFYIHAAQHHDPQASIRPTIVVTNTTHRGIVIAVCPRAATYGITVGMSVREAHHCCRLIHTTVIDEGAAKHAALQIDRVLRGHANTVTQLTIGTWMLKLIALGRDYRYAEAATQHLQCDVLEQTKMSTVIGVGSNRLIASIATEVALQLDRKHLIVLPGSERLFLAPLAVRLLPGVGAQTERMLRQLGITTIGQLAQVEQAALVSYLGSCGRMLYMRALGYDVETERDRHAVLTEQWNITHEPCADARRLHRETHVLTERVGRALRRQGVAAGECTVRLGWVDGRTTHSTQQCNPRCDLDRDLTTHSGQALDYLLAERRLAVVSIEVSVADLGAIQTDLFASADTRPRQLQQAIDSVRRQQGTGAIMTGSLLRG